MDCSRSPVKQNMTRQGTNTACGNEYMRDRYIKHSLTGSVFNFGFFLDVTIIIILTIPLISLKFKTVNI